MFWDNAIPIMKKKRISQRDISKITNRPFTTVNSWIKRECPPQADDALKIADMLEVSLRFLVTGMDDNDLSGKEKELLKACRGFSESMYNKMIDEADGIRKMMSEEKGDSLESDMVAK